MTRQNADSSATYKKLDDDEWGVWTDLDCRVGQRISVTTRTGKVNLEKLVEHISDSQNGEWHLWRIEQ